MREVLSLFKDMVRSRSLPEPSYFPDDQIDWSTISRRISPDDHPACVATGFAVKHFLVKDRGMSSEQVVFKSVGYGGHLEHLWAETDGMVVDTPEFRNKAKRGIRNVYKVGRRDLGYEQIWVQLHEAGEFNK